jgi:hypothetical protein
MTVPKIIDRLNAVSETTASPESITYLPNRISPANLRQLVKTLGLSAEIQAAIATDGFVDIGVVDAALSKSKLGIAERLQIKLALFGSGFKKGN